MSKLTERIEVALKQVMATPTKRDLQVQVGPSDLADPCNYCLGGKLAGVKEKRDFSMYAWIGSAIHKLIEYLISPKHLAEIVSQSMLAMEIFGAEGVRTEMFFERGIWIEGYGWCPAHIDLLLPTEGAIVDWKSTSVKKLRSYKVKGVPTSNAGQTMLYVHVARTNGYNVTKAVLVYIPRDAGSLHDIWAHEIDYDEQIVQQIITRAESIMRWVTAGRWKELEKLPSCTTCFPGFIR